MARIRSIKPEFWQDEKLARLPRDARLLFIGLWNMADDEGRLRGAPLFIRSQILPYDLDFNVDEALQHLAEAGCIQRYTAGTESYVWVRNFAKHQKIDARYASHLPPPPEERAPPTKRRAPPDAGRAPPKKSLGTGNREQGEEQGAGADSAASAANPPEPVDPLVAAWAEECPMLPQWRDPPDKARKKLIADALARRPLEEWRTVFKRIALSAFLTGSDGGWKADLEWALRPAGKKPESARKVLEGSFDRGSVTRLKPDVRKGMVMAQDCDHSKTPVGIVNDF